MKTKNLILIVVMLCTIPTLMHAQRPQAPFRERMEAARVAYITRHMQLTPEEARIFWPLYDAYIEKIKDHRQARVEGREELKNLDNLSDKEVNRLIDEHLNHAEAAFKARKEFIQNLRKELSARKAAMFIGAEGQFQREFIDRMRPGMDDERPLPPPRRW